ncbi:SMP-30/gluconolactonase/LRE family protein [Rufibacter latericius]|uniref:SMP-30/gluconolactonase/LRE family protein n=1 Tax=Rufibacter latericius TaxID=2487040 RepID=A0A3M9MKP9_9BACT|nr:SMP-30/gluconolactonase/LRE family protein [Rufibacter latericius]RNI26059.1 SMP-30/gluconolactonase/LRE family protein [Rufibacter latericius]
MTKRTVLVVFAGAALFFLLPALLKAQITDKNSIIAKGAKLEKLGDGYAFTEGPAVDREGNVYFTDQPNNKVYKWTASTGKISLFTDQAGRSNGLYFDQKGNLIAAADMDNQLWSFDKTGKPAVLVKEYKGKPLNGPNDLWISPTGAMYITDPLYKRDYWTRNPERQQAGEYVYYLSPDRKKFYSVDTTLVKPNGIVGTPDGKKLYVADIEAGKTYEYTIDKDGSLSGKKLFANMGSDGMTIDRQGNVYLTGKGVTVFDKEGQQIAHIPIQENWTANVVFGGKDRSTLFITAMGSVYGLKMKVKGL